MSEIVLLQMGTRELKERERANGIPLARKRDGKIARESWRRLRLRECLPRYGLFWMMIKKKESR